MFYAYVLKANKLTVMRSMVRAVSSSGGLGSFRSSGNGNGNDGSDGNGDNDDGEDLGGLVYAQDEEVPETRFAVQLRRYRALVRVAGGGGGRFCHSRRPSGVPLPVVMYRGAVLYIYSRGKKGHVFVVRGLVVPAR